MVEKIESFKIHLKQDSLLPSRRIILVTSLLTAILLFGTIGYVAIEGWSVLDSFYMTLITVTTIGYGEVHNLSSYGRLFTSLLIICGVGTMGYFLGTLTQFIVEGEIKKTFGHRKMQKDIKNLKNHYIVCGYGKIGRQVCEELRSRGSEIVVVESEAPAVELAKHDGFYTILADATSDDALILAAIKNAKGLIGAVGSDADNVFITLSAKELKPDLFVVVRAESPSSDRKLRRAGANRIVSPDLIGGKKMALAAMRPNIVEFMDIITPEEKTNFTIEEIIVSATSPIAGKTIVDSEVRKQAGVIIIGIKKNDNFIFNPSAQDVIQSGDILIVVGSASQLDKMHKISN